jgi:PAS domain S-box-containing protein
VRYSLTVKVVLAIIIVMGLGGTMVSLVVFKGSESALKDQISKEQLQLAQQTMDKLDRFLYERRIDIQTFSGHGQLSELLVNDSAQQKNLASKDLESIKTYDAVWGDISVLDTRGKTVVSTNERDEKTGVLAEDPSVQALYARAVKGEVVYSDLEQASDNEEPLIFYMAPIRSVSQSSEVIGVIEGELAWPSALEILQSLQTPAQIINKDGLLLGDNDPTSTQQILKTSYNDNQTFKEISGAHDGTVTAPALGHSNTSTLVSHVREAGYLEYKGNGWLLALQTPTEKAADPGGKLAVKLIVPFVGILLLAIVVFLGILNLVILRPLSNLRLVVGRLGQGDFALRTTITSHDEIGDLGQGFNDMADKIQDAYTSLRFRTEQAEEQQRLTQTLLENLPVGVLVVRAASGKVTMTNKTAESISGRTSKDMLASDNFSHALEIVKEDGSPYPLEERPLSVTIRTGQSCLKDDLYIKRPDGMTIATRTIASPIAHKDGKVDLVVSVFEDVTKERNLERSREEFFSIASHELRTPLTAIRGNSDLIQQYYGDQLKDPELKEMVSDIHESANRLIEIVNDFLDTSRLEQKRMKFNYELIDMAELAHSVIKEYQVTGSRQNIALVIKEPVQPLPKVFADRNRTKQVLINLVGNALKFTEKGSITISFDAKNGFVKTYVRDTGHGMSPEAQGLLFRKFEQTSTSVLTRDSVRGTGLGLYISRMLTEQMHGHIQLESSILEQGTTFSFSLPVAQDTDKPDIVHPDIVSGKL